MVLPVQRHYYCVPLLSPFSKLGQAVCQDSHGLANAKSAASTHAPASRYWHHSPSAMLYFNLLADKCYKCRKILQKRGTNLISPLRSIGENSLIEGRNLMVDVCGHSTFFASPRPAKPTPEALPEHGETVSNCMCLSPCVCIHIALRLRS